MKDGLKVVAVGLFFEFVVAVAGEHGPPGSRGDVVANEADAAIGEAGVDAANVAAARLRPAAEAVPAGQRFLIFGSPRSLVTKQNQTISPQRRGGAEKK